jgi:hypothetical protein
MKSIFKEINRHVQVGILFDEYLSTEYGFFKTFYKFKLIYYLMFNILNASSKIL